MKKKSLQTGFTLIELMVVIVILGILIATGIANVKIAVNRARIADVKVNMHTFQTMVEIYSGKWSGFYPQNVSQLYTEATSPDSPYWKELKNPYLETFGPGKSYGDESSPKVKGIMTYDPYPPTLVTAYYIYGYEEDSVRIQTRSGDYTVSNK